MPLWHPSSPVAIALDIVAWGLVHAATGYLAHRIPAGRLDHDNWLFRARAFEHGGRTYQRLFRIMRWKDRLPEAGATFDGGVSKRSLLGADSAMLARFAVETRRAELAHWLAMLPGPLFALWNPLHVVPVMIAYGIGVNLPFVMIQRFNRLRIERILHKRASRLHA